MIECVRPVELKENVIMEENEDGNSTLSLYAFIRGVVSCSECDMKFTSDSAPLKGSNPTVE
ncbi:MAG: hypothetical protein MJ200_04455 [Mycoplasmoidaceae bacterium]|nr:hypothetical protein [Mycoplasmoidaceae bacterium]